MSGIDSTLDESLIHTRYPRAFGHALRLASRAATARWNLALRRTKSVQTAQLLSAVKHAAKTEFGKAHDFKDLQGYEDFVKRVPVTDYDGYAPYIDRMRQGERDVLWPGFVEHFGNSSGSTNAHRVKYLPLTEEQVRHQQRAGADVLMRYLAWSGDAEFTRGFTLALFPPITMKREGPVLVTCNPAMMATRMPRVSKPLYLPHPDVMTISDYDQKLAVVAERYFNHDVRAVTGTTCWFSLLFDKVLETAKRRGHRARVISDVWPNLRVLIGGGVSADPYKAVLREQIGRDFTLIDTYNATEGGLFAASDFSGAPGMLMLPHRGVFFEFVPLEEHERLAPTRVPLWQVQRDRLYAIVVTTSTGLFAYKLGDIVRFPSLDPLRMEFAGRIAGCLSVTQELTTHIEIEGAVAHALSAVPATTVDFGAGAEVGVDGGPKSRYVLFVEFDDGRSPSDLASFAKAFDEGLCRLNRVYREHRDRDVAILPPKVVALPQGGSRRYLEQVTRGNVQGKFPRILDAAKMDALQRFLGEGSTTAGSF